METHSFAETFRLLVELETEGVLERYALVGAVAFEAPERRRLERAGALLDSPQFDHAALAGILARHGIPNRSPDRL